MANKLSENLVWLDLEMTGLEVDKHVIVEIATIVTNNELTILAEGPVIAITQPPEKMALMPDVVVKMHTKSGLIKRVQNSSVTVAEAEQQTLTFLQQYLKAGESPLCGNSVYMDRRFLAHYMPMLNEFFHYRLIDVSTVKELASRWHPELKKFAKESAHRALTDIRESIEELKYYREHFFK